MCDGQVEQTATKLEHESDSGQAHDTRKGRALIVASAWIPFSTSYEISPWATRYCPCQIQDGGFRAWMFLASAQGLQES